MTSLTRECKDDAPGIASSASVQQQDGGLEVSDINKSSKSRRRREVADEVPDAKSQTTKPSAVSSDRPSGNELPLSTSGREQGVRSGVEKPIPELVISGGKETAAKVGSGRGQAVRSAKAELAPPSRSRSRDRRLSMSIIDTVFRRRHRQSLAPSVHESSDSEVSTALSATTASTGTQLRYFFY